MACDGDFTYKKTVENEENCKDLEALEKSLSYCLSKEPASLRMVDLNTNLNEPPSHWNDGSSQWESLHTSRQDDIFYSLRLARNYMHMTGIIDVISNGENIKKLLKIPYSKANVSLMVHRIGNTLVLDNFDVHHNLLKRQADDWEWLKKFYHEVLIDQTKMPVAEVTKERDKIFSKNMMAKYLYHSSLEQTYHQPSFPSTQRTHLWNFEDIRMLIGTDLPIFGGGTHPCVSLKLQFVSQLTVFDHFHSQIAISKIVLVSLAYQIFFMLFIFNKSEFIC